MNIIEMYHNGLVNTFQIVDQGCVVCLDQQIGGCFACPCITKPIFFKVRNPCGIDSNPTLETLLEKMLERISREDLTRILDKTLNKKVIVKEGIPKVAKEVEEE